MGWGAPGNADGVKVGMAELKLMLPLLLIQACV